MGGGAAGKFWDVLGGLVFVALATTIVVHKGSAQDITAAGSAFSSGIKAATGG
jgi:hypothetical protein